MFSSTRTEPMRDTRPTSLRPRSMSMTCSARSFGSARSSASRRASSSGVAPRGRVPAMGRTVTRAPGSPSTRTSTSGEAPVTCAVAEVELEHVRRRVDHAQRAVDVERIGAGARRLEALREHDLEDVAGEDVLLGARHRRLVRPRASCSTTAARRRPRAAARIERPQRAATAPCSVATMASMRAQAAR